MYIFKNLNEKIILLTPLIWWYKFQNTKKAPQILDFFVGHPQKQNKFLSVLISCSTFVNLNWICFLATS